MPLFFFPDVGQGGESGCTTHRSSKCEVRHSEHNSYLQFGAAPLSILSEKHPLPPQKCILVLRESNVGWNHWGQLRGEPDSR